MAGVLSNGLCALGLMRLGGVTWDARGDRERSDKRRKSVSDP